MLLPLAPVLHLIVPLQLLAVNIALSPSHKLVLLAKMLGDVGLSPLVMITGTLALLTPHSVSHTAV